MFVDCESSSGIIKPGEWRGVIDKDLGCLSELSDVRESRSRQDLLDFRNGIKNYFKTEQRQVNWQYSRAKRTWKEKSRLSTLGQRQTKIAHHKKIKFLNIKTEMLHNILKQSYENGFLVLVFPQYIVTYYELELGDKGMIFGIHLLLDIWEHCLLYSYSLLIFSFSKEQIWQLMWVIKNLL